MNQPTVAVSNSLPPQGEDVLNILKEAHFNKSKLPDSGVVAFQFESNVGPATIVVIKNTNKTLDKIPTAKVLRKSNKKGNLIYFVTPEHSFLFCPDQSKMILDRLVTLH